MSAVEVRTLPPPPVCVQEVFRFANMPPTICAEELHRVLRAIEEVAQYRVCFATFPLDVAGETCRIGGFAIESAQLAKNLKGCKTVLLFAATVGVGVDRLLQRYQRLSPAGAFLAHAAGAERAESLCNAFCKAYASERGVKLRPRFSPGYGDLSLDEQRTLFALLGCEKNIGLTLNESLLISPSKSVTAFVGIEE